jgi:hypothetical protein
VHHRGDDEKCKGWLAVVWLGLGIQFAVTVRVGSDTNDPYEVLTRAMAENAGV